MRKQIKKKVMSIFESAKILLCYIPGIAVMVLFWLGRRLGRIKVLHEERLPDSIADTVIPYNHPSVIDHWFIAGLLARFWAPHPLAQAPLIAADKKLFYDSKKILLRIFRPAMIAIDRDSGKRDAAAVLEMRETQRPILICPEGRRTFRGEEWIYCNGGNNENGGRIARFKSGAGNLIKKRKAMALPIAIIGSHKVVPNDKNRLWTHFNFFGTVTIVIGEPVRFDPALEKWEITQMLEGKILSLIREGV